MMRLGPALVALAAATATATAGWAAPEGHGWPGEEMPLPLAVRTPQDLAVKAVAERQYLIFNLLAGGKLAWDRGDAATAAAKWEALLRIEGLDPEVEKVIRPLAREARGRAGGAPSAAAPPAVPEPTSPSSSGSTPTGPVGPRTVSLTGTVTGGGPAGPGGAVIWLRRVAGETPHPAPARGKVVTQRGKTFLPRVLAIPVGTKVTFRNEDPIFHNIFSLSKPNEFDTGLYKQGGSYTATFKHPGPVQLLCNIHSSMLGFVVVVDSPWYAQAEATGAFTIKGVPPGEYEVNVWHEAAAKPTQERVTVGADGVRGFTLRVGGERRAPQFLPDKSGKPRQSHLGY